MDKKWIIWFVLISLSFMYSDFKKAEIFILSQLLINAVFLSYIAVSLKKSGNKFRRILKSIGRMIVLSFIPLIFSIALLFQTLSISGNASLFAFVFAIVLSMIIVKEIVFFSTLAVSLIISFIVYLFYPERKTFSHKRKD